MSLKTRRVLFYFFFLLFIIIGPIAIIYSYGWNLNFIDGTIKIQKTGAIYVETRPKEVNIKIDGKTIKDESGIIQEGTLIDNIAPKKYKLQITKIGYKNWEKNLLVKPELVAEAINVMLIPEKIKEEKIAFKKLRGEEIVAQGQQDKFIIKNERTKNYYLYDKNNEDSALNINANLISLRKDFKNIVFHPFESNKLIFETKNGIEIFNVPRLKIETVIEKTPSAWTIKNPNIYYILKNKELRVFSLLTKTDSLITYLPEGINPLNSNILKIESSGEAIAMINSLNDLIIIDRQTPVKIAHNAELFALSPDAKKIAFSENGKIKIYFIKNWQKNFYRKAGETADLETEAFLNIKNIKWHNNSYHLFIEYGDDKNKSVDFMEIDERKPINKYNLLNGIRSFYYDSKNDLSYYTKDYAVYFFKIE